MQNLLGRSREDVLVRDTEALKSAIVLIRNVVLQSLASIRSVLARLEETIIFCPSAFLSLLLSHIQRSSPPLALIERAQFAQNPRVYAKDGFKDVLHKDGFAGSWLDWFLLESESMCGRFFSLKSILKLLNMRSSESQALREVPLCLLVKGISY